FDVTMTQASMIVKEATEDMTKVRQASE
ncbi:hypothetical protein LCGC14_3050420, partial [marine sediment metagenome]